METQRFDREKEVRAYRKTCESNDGILIINNEVTKLDQGPSL